MKIFRYLIEKAKDKYKEKYIDLLLSGKIRLRDVPEWLRMDYRRTSSIHISAFRADRGFSKDWYAEDLNFLEVEILMANSFQNPLLEASLRKCHKWGAEIHNI